MKHITKFVKNKPYCPNCGEEYPDACYGEVKNYPDDEGLAVFMNCENCDEEAEVFFDWKDAK